MKGTQVLLSALLLLAGCAHVDANYPDRPPEKKKGWTGDVFENIFENEFVVIRVSDTEIPVDNLREIQATLLSRKKASLPPSEFKKFKASYQKINPLTAIMKEDYEHDYFKVEIRYKTSARHKLENGFFIFEKKFGDNTVSVRDAGLLVEKRGDRAGFLNGQHGPIEIGRYFNEPPPGVWDKAEVRVAIGGKIVGVSYDESKISMLEPME